MEVITYLDGNLRKSLKLIFGFLTELDWGNYHNVVVVIEGANCKFLTIFNRNDLNQI